MKKIVCFSLMLFAMAVAVKSQESLYHRYATNKNVSAACILGYRLDGSNTIDVAMLQAKDAASWQLLSDDFSIDTLLPQQFRHTMEEGGSVFQTRFADRENPHLTAPQKNGETDVSRCCFLGIDYRCHTIWVFYYHNMEQLHYLNDHLALSDDHRCGAEEGKEGVFYCFSSQQSLGAGLLSGMGQ